MAIDKKSKAPNTTVNPSANEQDSWDEQQTAFPPYWEPEIGGSFVASCQAIDRRDPAFVRIVWRAIEPLACKTGDKENQEDVLVGEGELFTTGMYAVFASMTLDEIYVGVPMKVEVTGEKTSKSTGFNYFTFSCKTDPTFRNQIAERRKAFELSQTQAVPAELRS